MIYSDSHYVPFAVGSSGTDFFLNDIEFSVSLHPEICNDVVPLMHCKAYLVFLTWFGTVKHRIKKTN